LESFMQDVMKNYPKMAQIQQKVGTAGFDKDELLPLVDSMMHGHMEGFNRRFEEAAAKVQKQAIAEIYASFTSLEVSLEVVAKKSIPNEWAQIKSNKALDSGNFNRCKQKFKETCSTLVKQQANAKQRELEEANNQKKELEALLRSEGINLSLKVLSARKGFQAEYRQLYTQNQKLDFLDLNIVKKGITNFVLEEKAREKAKNDNEKKQAESSRQENASKAKNEQLRVHQEQTIIQLVDQLFKINPGLMNELYNKAKFNIAGESAGDLISQMKKGPFNANKFAIIKASLESKIEAEANGKADAEDAGKQAKLAEKQAKVAEQKKRMEAKREQTRKEKAANERREDKRAPKVTMDKNPEWQTREHVNFGHVQRIAASGGSGTGVTRVVPKGAGAAIGARGTTVNRIVPKGATEIRTARVVQKGATLAGQFEKAVAVGPQVTPTYAY